MATVPNHGAIPKGDNAAHPIGYVQSADPGAIGADKPWCDITSDASGHFTIKIRKTDDSGWLTPNATHLGGDAAALFAKLASPALTGTPTVPTAAPGTNTTQAASTAFVAAAVAAGVGGAVSAISIQLDGGGVSLTTGIKGDIQIPFACTITAARLLADQAGSLVVDIWKDTFANFPPVDGDSITASAPPTLTAAAKSEDTTLTGWTTSIAAGDVLRFNIDSAATITRATLTLTVTRT